MTSGICGTVGGDMTTANEQAGAFLVFGYARAVTSQAALAGRFGVVIPAAGSGSRFGGDKLSQNIAGKSVIEHAVDAFRHREDVGLVVVVGKPIDLDRVSWCPGGETRSESVKLGLDHLRQLRPDCDFVAVHDAARPAVSQALIDRVFDAAVRHGAAVPGLVPTDTIKRVESDRIVETLSRQSLLAVQTPQAMRVDWLVDAYSKPTSQDDVTDDVSLLELAGYGVICVEGDTSNIKLTHSDDLQRLEQVLGRRT